MANDQSENKAKPTATAAASPALGSLGVLGSENLSPAPVGAGGVPTAPGPPPAGGIALALGADVSQQMLDTAPVFGDVLRSLGNGIATSQAALDRSIVDTVNALNSTRINVVTDVIEKLNDDGLPDVAQTTLVTNNLSVLNFFTPTVHEWKNVALSMDLEISAIDNENGLSFQRDQSSRGARGVGLLWGFVGWFSTSSHETSYNYTSSSTNEVAWTKGQVRMDALLGPRRTTKFPVPATVTTGPQIYISQGSVAETVVDGVVTERSVDVLITVRKEDGSVNGQKTLVLDAAGLLPSFKSDEGFTGSTTNPQGKVQVKLTRALSPGFTRAYQRTIAVSLGGIRKTMTVVI